MDQILAQGGTGRNVTMKHLTPKTEVFVHGFGFLRAFRCFDSSFLMLFTVGSSSGMVPPSSLMVWRTLAPTSRWAWLALSLPVIFSRRSLSSA